VELIIPTAGTAIQYTPADIINKLLTQLGLGAAASTTINVKLQRVDLYAVATASTSDRPACFLNCSSLTPQVSTSSSGAATVASYGVLKKLNDLGNLSQAAVCSYTWPLHMSDLPLDAAAPFFCFSASGNTANVTVRVHVQWANTAVILGE
jgi:hypothetical protein